MTASQNALKHGLTATISPKDVKRFMDMILAEFMRKTGAEMSDLALLRIEMLARAEARLARIRQLEAAVIGRGDPVIRSEAEKEHFRCILENVEKFRASLPEWNRRKPNIQEISAGIQAGRDLRHIYRTVLRYVRSAEAQHSVALLAVTKEM